ncbi:MAG: CdaR family protein [Bdellovibrionales bacterium]|nr:CdaR family protein [Bdellovibrionales bacterium]
MNKVFEWIFANGTFKIVALVVSIVLWMTIMGRRDLVQNHEMEIQFILPAGHTIANQVTKSVEVKVTGPRAGLQRFTERERVIGMDLSKLKVGDHKLFVRTDNVNLPLGVKILSIEPQFVNVNLRQFELTRGQDESEEK